MEPTIHTLSTTKAAGAGPLSVECLYARIPHDFNYIQADPGHHKSPHPYGAGDSFMLILTGSMELMVDGETFPLKAGQMAVIPKGAHRGFTAGPEGMTMLAAHLRDE
ncbi:MAG TPA: cupin domain-containing protein [Symbiobacteriaceae bacterium]|jgi:mannose-6-phosphate isomerase-like protein (cupin superfamily)|nr:cupin domain-containing protein [Symbiobacteriaceae bacterium]